MAGGTRLLAAAIAIAAPALAPAAARADFTAPELFVSEGDSSSLQNQPPVWQPMGSATVHGGYRYRLGVRLQPSSDPSGRQYVLINGLTTPQAPSSGAAVYPAPGSCALVRGTAGDIVELGTASYYGDGTYTLSASMAAFANGPCPASGVAGSGTFTVDTRATVTIVGDPRSNDARPADGTFRGVSLIPTPDAVSSEIRCALDPVVQADGSLTGSKITHSFEILQPDGSYGLPEADAFPDAGNWACVARAQGGPDSTPTAWSTPATATIHGDFHIRGPDFVDRSYPTYVFRFSVDRGAAGAKLTFHLKSCAKYSRDQHGRPFPTKRWTLATTINARGNAVFRFRRRIPAAQFGHYYVGRAQFSGNDLIAPAVTNRYAWSEYIDPHNGAEMGVYPKPGC